MCVDSEKKNVHARRAKKHHKHQCFFLNLFWMFYVQCYFCIYLQWEYFHQVYFYSGSFYLNFLCSCKRHKPTPFAVFFFFHVQLCNYFHCALPVESSSKLHVSRCGKYMTFGGASLRENNVDCATPGPVAFCLIYYFFVISFVCIFFFLAEQKSLSPPNFAKHLWRRVEQPLTTSASLF